MRSIQQPELKLARHILILCGATLTSLEDTDVDEQTKFCIDRLIREMDNVKDCLESEIKWADKTKQEDSK